jgi:hypothetical protein
MNNFDTQPLLSEINTVINNGFQDILKDYMKRYWLLEQTHDTLVNLPTVKQHYANKTECDSHHYKDVKVKLEPGVEYVTKEETLKLIKNIDDKMNDFLKLNNELFNKLSIQMNELKTEIDSLKNEKKNSVSFSNSNVEKENIKLEIVDDAVNECKIDVNDEEGEEEEEEEEEEVVEVTVESKINELVIDVEEEEEEEEEEEVASV